MGSWTTQDSAEDCAHLCYATSGCKSFTFGKPDKPHSKRCWLKNAFKASRVGSDEVDSGPPCAAACEIDRSHDYQGNDMGSWTTQDSAEDCAHLCSATAGCKSFTYGKEGGEWSKKCWLKNAFKAGRFWNDQLDSGLPCSPTAAPTVATVALTKAPTPAATTVAPTEARGTTYRGGAWWQAGRIVSTRSPLQE